MGTPGVEDHDTRDCDTVVLDDDHHASPGVRASVAPDDEKKRKRSGFAKEGVGHMTFIIEVVKAVVHDITIVAPPDVHPTLYSAVMDASPTFIPDAKMVALSHLFDNRAQGKGFVQMAEDHREL
jgi:hypothetical protein